MNTQKLICLLFLIALTTVVGCVPGDGKHTAEKPAGFFWAIWHGWMAPISLIWSIFNSDIRIYEPQNTGWWYDFGFYIAISSGAGGSGAGGVSLSRRKRNKKVMQD